MAERSERRAARVRLPPSWAVHPDALDETVVHDPSGRPWLICTTDRLYETAAEDPAAVARADAPTPPYDTRYETQIFYTARAGIRGFPTGHGQRFRARDEALAGHRQWCLRVRLGSVEPDRAPEDPVDGQTA
jgi:hypothetical protein